MLGCHTSPGSRHLPRPGTPGSRPPWEQTPPSGPGTPLAHSMLGDTVKVDGTHPTAMQSCFINGSFIDSFERFTNIRELFTPKITTVLMIVISSLFFSQSLTSGGSRISQTAGGVWGGVPTPEKFMKIF